MSAHADDLAIVSQKFSELAALFKVIADKPNTELAELGAYVASDWANTADCMREAADEAEKQRIREGRNHAR